MAAYGIQNSCFGASGVLAGSTIQYKQYGGPMLYPTLESVFYKHFLNDCVTNSAVREKKT